MIFAGKWDLDKNVNDFIVVAENLRKEGHQSRADVVDHLIERVKILESKIELLKITIENI